MLFVDTQEAPKSLTIDSSSSLESLASVDNDYPHSDNEICSTPQPTPKVIPKRIPPPFSRTVLPHKRLGGAFTSYVRRRGEPDGRTANPSDTKTLPDIKPRKTNTLARPGGGESDAAFTPSPPVVMQSENSSMALSLAHQTRIRLVGLVSFPIIVLRLIESYRLIKETNLIIIDFYFRNLYSQNDIKADPLRPDSSSSASSATDWESGHATVLRRQTQNQVSN